MAFNLRTPVADAFDERVPDNWVIVPSPVQLDGINKPTLQFFASDIARLPSAPVGTYAVTYTANLFSPNVTNVDDSLDEMLNTFMEAIWDLDFLTFESAARTVINDNNLHTWAVTFQAAITVQEND